MGKNVEKLENSKIVGIDGLHKMTEDESVRSDSTHTDVKHVGAGHGGGSHSYDKKGKASKTSEKGKGGGIQHNPSPPAGKIPPKKKGGK